VTALSDRRDERAEAEAADARRAASGDEQAFARLYHAHAARIHSLARRLVGHEDADEATQDVFVRAWSKLDRFEGRSSFGTWLYRLAINVMLAGRATRGRWESRIRGGDEMLQRRESRRWTPELHLDFEAAIGRLPERARRVFVLHDIEGFKHAEIGELLGVTAGTSKAQLHRARLMLRQYVER
jgi:RNA polymerase sigma-70 factor (ECF subfamily)